MLGSLLSSAIKLGTSPLDIVDAAVDVVLHDGDGSKESRKRNGSPLACVTETRDAIATVVKSVDD